MLHDVIDYGRKHVACQAMFPRPDRKRVAQKSRGNRRGGFTVQGRERRRFDRGLVQTHGGVPSTSRALTPRTDLEKANPTGGWPGPQSVHATSAEL